jgi:hypothetical protein
VEQGEEGESPEFRIHSRSHVRMRRLYVYMSHSDVRTIEVVCMFQTYDRSRGYRVSIACNSTKSSRENAGCGRVGSTRSTRGKTGV